nr:deoxynucleotidyltransferase terminal-interacting protein 1-like [Anolis sagrei ordinatus]
MTWQCGLIQSSPKQIIIWDQILGYRSSVDRASVKRGPFGKSWGQRTGSSGPSSNLCSGPKFFQKAAGNVRENTGEDLDTEQLIHETCRNCLEQAKLLFCDGKKSVARLPHERKGRPPGQSQLSNQKPVAVNIGSLELKLDELKPFTAPAWMAQKMRTAMEALRCGCEGDPPPPPKDA